MKTAIRRYLLTRRMRKLAQHLQFLMQEEKRNVAEQQYVIRALESAATQRNDLDIKSRREMMV